MAKDNSYFIHFVPNIFSDSTLHVESSCSNSIKLVPRCHLSLLKEQGAVSVFNHKILRSKISARQPVTAQFGVGLTGKMEENEVSKK